MRCAYLINELILLKSKLQIFKNGYFYLGEKAMENLFSSLFSIPIKGPYKIKFGHFLYFSDFPVYNKLFLYIVPLWSDRETISSVFVKEPFDSTSSITSYKFDPHRKTHPQKTNRVIMFVRVRASANTRINNASGASSASSRHGTWPTPIKFQRARFYYASASTIQLSI